MNHEYLTIRDVAQLLQVNPRTVRRWIWSGKLPYIKVGRSVRVPQSVFDSMVIAGQKGVQRMISPPPERQARVADVLAQLDMACEQIRAHVGNVEDSVAVLARIRARHQSNA